MRIFAAILVLFTGSLTRLAAGESLGKCFDADAEEFVKIAEAAPTSEYLLTAKMPVVQIEDHLATLKWIDCPTDVSARREQIGSYRNRAIYRTIYLKRADDKEDAPRFVCMVFAYQSSNWVGETRPFFILPNEDGLWGNDPQSYFTSWRDEPFALEISCTMLGTGVFSTDCTFVFTPNEARLVRRSQSGRHTRTKTYSYNRKGKVVKVETTAND